MIAAVEAPTIALTSLKEFNFKFSSAAISASLPIFISDSLDKRASPPAIFIGLIAPNTETANFPAVMEIGVS